MRSPRPSAFRKCCAAVVAAALTLQPLGAYAAPIATSQLAESPLVGKNRVKPNIMFTLDDSSSMNSDYLPDYAGESPGYCRDSFAGTSSCRLTPAPGSVASFAPPIRSSAFNGQYYDPTATYLPGKTADGIDLPCEGTDITCAAPWTSVYVNGFAGYPNSNGGGVANLVTGYPDNVFCNNLAAFTPSAADLATAYGDGTICRLNGRPYAKLLDASGLWTIPAVAAGYNYPNRLDPSTGVATVCNTNEKCVFGSVFGGRSPVVANGNPYYYTISKVQFCSSVAANGFGTPPCQDRQDPTTFKYVRYGTDPAKSFDPQAFTRVDITPAGFSVNGAPANSTDPSGSSRTPSQAMSNFAKWYAFDRTRLLAMKTAGGSAFSALNQNNARVGFSTLAENATLFQNVVPFDTAGKTLWFTKFYAVTPPVSQNTPLPDAVFRVGEYFRENGSSGLPGATNPIDPDTGQCQMNFHLVATDGYWNVPLSAGSVGDQDGGTVPTPPAPIAGFTPGLAFPRPYLDANASSNTLSDLGMKYWITDLQPSLANKVPDTTAPWQHLTLYGVSIGAQGNIVYPAGIDAITAGANTVTAPAPQLINWPAPTGTGTPDSIDDLWHAAINSRGKFFDATNPQSLANSIVSALNDFVGPNGTGTGVGIVGAQLTSANGFGYLTSYDSAWAGDVKKYALDPITGAIPGDPNSGNPLNPPLWSAQVQLDALVLDTGWDTNRRIVTINDSTGVAVPFRLGYLSSTQQASLNAGWVAYGVAPIPTANDVLNYLRGQKSNEGVNATSFRVRTHALGDVVYSGAVAVGAPSEPYSDPGFLSFVAANKTRTPTVYVGGNDGMLHAFNDSTGADAGKETWAYVPAALFSGGDPNDTAHNPDPMFQLGALSFNSGVTINTAKAGHVFFVNATPRVWDIDFANTNTSTPPTSGNDWRTLLIGGLGAGGRAVYALDVTTPVLPPPPPSSVDTETSITSKVLWEYSESDLGYVFDAPTLVKTLAYGWVALVASGYNNSGGSNPGKGFLYVLDPKTGHLLQKMVLPGDTGTAASPTGLSTVRAFTASRKNPYVLQAYGGDLKGNVWRFDLSDPNAANWKTELIATLKDAAGNPQPITTGVRIEIDQTNNVDRYIFVGTGKLLGDADFTDNSVTNSLYVLRDGTITAPGPVPAILNPRGDTTNVHAVIGTTIAGFSGATGRGWYQDASDPSQRIVTDVFADVQTVVYSFSAPQSDPCLGALTSTLYARDFTSGNSVLQDQGGTVQSGIAVGEGVAGIQLIQSTTGDVRLQVTTFRPVPGKGQVFSFGVKLTGGPTNKHRVSWRLINRD